MRLLLILAALLVETRAQAIVMIRAQSGAAMTQMIKESGSSLSGKGFSYGGTISWHPGNGQKMSPFLIGIMARQIKSTYYENNIEKRSTYNTFGPTIGYYSSLSETWGIESALAYLPGAELTSLSTNQVQLNGSTLHYSTWQQYSGDAASEFRLGLIHEKTSGQFSKKNRFRIGGTLSYLQQAFHSVDTEVSNSRELLTPAQTSTLEESEALYKVFSLELFFGITF